MLMFLYHVHHLNYDALGKEVLEQMKILELPGLWQESLEYMRKIDIKVEELDILSKTQWKMRVKSAVENWNRLELLKQIEPYSKLDVVELSKDKNTTKPKLFSLSLSQARTKFALDSKMLKTVKSLYSSDRKNEEDRWECRQCTRVCSIRHLKICPYFEEERKNRNLLEDDDLISYFQEIIKIRMNDEQA